MLKNKATITPTPNATIREFFCITGRFFHQFPGEYFGYYLAGLIDGGCMHFHDNSVVIFFYNSELPLVNFLQKRLGFGVISKDEDTAYVEFTISGNNNLITFFDLINNKLL
jgi:hypothetical protein